MIAAQTLARRQRISLGEAVSELVRRGASTPAPADAAPSRQTLRGRFALLPARDEIITTDHIRALMDQEGR